MRSKLTALILVLCQLAALVSCGSGEAADTAAESESETETTAVETEYLDTLPDTRYDGYEFRIIAQSTEQRPNLPLYDEENGEVLNDSIHRRNRTVEDLLGITIVNLPYSDRGEVHKLVNTTVLADEDAYDLVINSICDGINHNINNGVLYDLSKLEHLSLESEWWCPSLIEDQSINGSMYFTTGPLSPFYFYMMNAVAYNKTVTDENGVTGLEQLVLDGGWTFDKMKEYSKNVAADLNGDGKLDETDKWGVATGVMYQLIAGFGEKMTRRTESGGFRLTLGDSNFIDALDKVASFASDASVVLNSSSTDVWLKVFQEDRTMFMPTSMNNIITGYNKLPSCREMESDYGVLTLPKLDDSQDRYYTNISPYGPSGIAVPKTCRDTSRTLHIMEVMAYCSNDIIREAAYESVVKAKSLRLPGNEEVLDLIYSSVYIDVNDVFNFGGTTQLFDKAMLEGSGTFVSGYAAIKANAEAALAEYCQKLSGGN